MRKEGRNVKKACVFLKAAGAFFICLCAIFALATWESVGAVNAALHSNNLLLSQKIIFLSDGTGQIATINPDGTGYTVLGQGFDPKISPDGTHILLTRSLSKFNEDIYVMNADGTGPTDLTGDNAGPDFSPAWSPDGTKIAFMSNRNGTGGVYVMNADGSNVQLLVPNASASGHPTWSPDGTRIAFEMEYNGASEIAVTNADGSNVTLLTTNFGFNGYPAWSPDGTRIAWVANCNCNSPSTISTMKPDGTGRVDLYSPPTGGDVTTPAWSPDSSTIIFTAYNPNAGPPTDYRLFSINSTGGIPQQIYADSAGVDTPFWGQLSLTDTTPPVLTLPNALLVDATSTAGANVTYTATATDDDGTTPTVFCSPPPGTTFPIGTTTVNCSATDTVGNTATGSFTVTVKGASDQLNDSITLVNSFHLSGGVQSSLDGQLQTVLADIQASNTSLACSDLTGYIHHVKAQSGKGLTVNQANQLLSAATNIEAVLPCYLRQ